MLGAGPALHCAALRCDVTGDWHDWVLVDSRRAWGFGALGLGGFF